MNKYKNLKYYYKAATLELASVVKVNDNCKLEQEDISKLSSKVKKRKKKSYKIEAFYKKANSELGLHGDCGMVAIALIYEGLIRRKNKDIQLVIAGDSSDPVNEEVSEEREEPYIYHSGMYYDNKFYDIRGEVSQDEFTNSEIVPFSLIKSDRDKPTEGHDYLLSTYLIDDIKDIENAYGFLDRNTSCQSNFEFYLDKAKDIWDKIKINMLEIIS